MKWTEPTRHGRNFRFALMALILTASPIAMGATLSDTRVSESRYFADSGRDQAEPNRVSTDEHKSNPVNDKAATRGSAQKAAAGQAAAAPNSDFWFYTADVELFADDDRDGYFHGIDLLFDVDTIYTVADVYAVVYLSLDGGPWVEYAETEDFTIWGTSGTDEHVVVTELLSGYPAGSYDLLIELFDADTNVFVADFGPESTSELSFLPLEDAERDAPVDAPAPPVAISRGGGGATAWLSLVVLGLFAAGRGLVRRRRRF